jgi:DNA invertase Pin-like site-specific DNA recombinase
MSLVGYARVSTTAQDAALQRDALAKAGCARIFDDQVSGVKAERSGPDAALEYLREGDTLIVWKLDRRGRSLPHLIETIARLGERRIGFQSLTEGVDTETPGGRLVFYMFGALAEFERCCQINAFGLEKRSSKLTCTSMKLNIAKYQLDDCMLSWQHIELYAFS